MTHPMTLDTDRKPREAIARAIYEQWAQIEGATTTWEQVLTAISREGYPNAKKYHAMALAEASAVLNLIRLNGWGSDLLLEAIHAEEDANGEPRSSVVPGVKT